MGEDETTQVAQNAPATQATQAPATQANTNKTSYKRNIISVTQGEKVNRYFFEVDGEPFKGLNQKGEEKEDTSFSKNLITVMRQVGAKTGLLSAAYAMARVKKNSYLNPLFVALCLQNAEIDFERDFKEASQEADANNPDDINGKDRYITTFKNIKLNIDPTILPLIAKALQSGKIMEEPLIINEADNNQKQLEQLAESLFD